LAAAFYSSICDALATLGSHYSRQQQRALSKPSLCFVRADLLLVLNQVVAFNIQEVYIFNRPTLRIKSVFFCSIGSKFEIHDRQFF
jgi:hypothetical protein